MVYYKVAEGATFTYMNLGRVETEHFVCRFPPFDFIIFQYALHDRNQQA